MTAGRGVLLATGGYGLAMLGTGVLVLLAPSEATGIVTPTRTVAAAPVVAPVVDPGATPSAGPSATPSAGASGASPSPAASTAVTEAAVGSDVGVVDPFVPERLVLWNGRTAPVLQSGVRADGSLVIPDDPGTVGWWTGGSQAGEAYGHVVVAGHIDRVDQGVGILAAIVRADRGDVVTLQAGGRSQRYRVVARREIPKADLAKDPTIFASDAPPRLVMITCGGRFDPVKHHYDDNIVVEAEPV